MWSGQRGEGTVPTAAPDSRREISAAWRSLNQSKSALRHIENHLEAVSSSGVVLDTLMTTEKTSVRGSRKASRKERRGTDDSAASKSQRSRNPEKSSRSPLRTSTQDNSAERPHTHSTHREVYPPPPPVAHCASAPSASLSELVYERDSRPEQTADLDSTRSSALDNTTIRFLNDPPVPGSAGAEVRPTGLQADGQTGAPAGSVSSSPGSASVRLEKLRQRQTDGKLEKLKERIRKQREQLEESAERERILGRLEQPVGIGASLGTTVPTAKVRKVAPAPPAPVYKGFNTSETTIRTADGRVWGEEEFHNYSREIYTHHFTDGVKPKPKEKEKKVVERKPVKPVRKIHRSASVPDPQTRPVISTSSWREGQKLVKMILGPSPRLPGEPRAQSAERERRTGASSRSSSDPRLELNRRSRPNSSERQTAKISKPAGGDRGRKPAVKEPSRPAGGDRGRSPSTDRLSADIQGILDDLQLEGGAERHEEGSPSRRSAARRAQAPIRSSRSVSPAKPHPDKKRQYDAEAVRQYIARQQEDRKRRQAEERRNQKETEQRRSQRLQELYRRQREGVAKPQAPPTNSTRSCLQDTYTKLLLEHRLQQSRPLYQPSGESDKENKRQEPPSPSHSDLSMSEHGPPALTRAELGVSSMPSAASLVPSTGQLFSQLLAMEGAAAISQPVDLSATHTIRTHPSRTAHASRLSRVEALKASAVSLSSRIESEALKLAGGGVNYGVDCSRNVGTGLPVIPQDDEANLVNSLSPPVRECPGGAEEPAQRIQRLLRAGQSAFGTDPAELPGVGNLYGFGSAERREYTAKPRPSPPNPAPLFPERAEHLDSSGGSISEGLLTESSMSDAEDHPGDPTDVLRDLPKPSLKLGGADYCASLQNGPTFDPITRFQREAEQHSPYRPAAALQDSRPPWGDLAKGSPNSVINIFTKNLQNYSRVLDVGTERGTPGLRAAGSASGSLNGLAYEDDFISSRSSSQSASRRTAASLSNGHSAAGADERRENGKSSKSSKSSTPLSSPHSTHSTSRKERSLERPPVDGQRSASRPVSELQWNGVKQSPSPNGSPRGSPRSADTDSPAGGTSVHSTHSAVSEHQPSPRSPAVSAGSLAGSPAGSPRVSPPSGSSHTSSPRPSSVRDTGLSAAAETGPGPETGTARAHGRSAAAVELQFAPGVLQQRLSAELSYIDSVEESVRQLGDVERVRAVSLAQQETVALAQILKAQQQRQERELQLLRLKAEQEALETQRQLQESRERAAQAHTEMCANLVQSQQQVLLGIQESSSRIINQQTETAQHTAATARHIREMTELARSQMLNVPTVTPFYDQQKEPRQQTDSSRSEVPPDSGQSPSAETPPDSLSESIPSRRPTISGGGSSARQSPSLSSSVKEVGGDGGGGVERSSSVEEEIHTAAEESLHTDSVQSLLEDRGDSASVATEYSLKFEESVTEDELEKSFRSLLPSESHWRDSLERNRSPLPESDEERSRAKSSPQLSNKDSSMPFSSGQDSFNKFTMTMVKQYMQEEEVRAQHQSSLLRLRHRALKEKTKAELAWLEHQKRRLRDKGEDDKMPPIRKKQRGLLLKLQQEQAEIRRLQEANKAARRERQLLLKQQEEIEKIRQSTLRLREKLRTAGDQSPRSSVSIDVKEAEPSLATDAETRSPSPLSVSGSETSSIMQKLKKMRSHMDERFLTEREQRLVRRRLQAEELLQWRQRLDAEEAAVRRMEKQALAAWEQHPQRKHSAQPAQDSTQSPSSATYRQERSADREAVSEGDSSPVSSARSAGWVSEQLVSPASDSPTSKLPSAHTSGSPHTHTDSAQPSNSPQSHSHETPVTNDGSSSKLVVHSPRSSEPRPSAPTSEAASDQSDIEGRVLALKEELRRRKTEVQRLKKAQKQRNKERLKAQEASLLKQLESYNNFIEKTKAELSKEADPTPTAKPQIKTPASGTEKPRIRSPALHRPEAEKKLKTFSSSEDKVLTESLIQSAGRSEPIGNHEVTSSDEDPPTVTPTPVFGSPERVGSSLESPEPRPIKTQSFTKPQPDVSPDESVVCSQRSDVIEELDYLKSEGSGDDHDSTHSDQHSQPLLKLDIQLPSHIRAEEVKPEEKTDLSETSHREAEEEQSGEPVTTKEPEALLEKSSSPVDGSYTPDFSPRKDLDEPKETQSPSVDRYNDDFESSFDSSLREDRKGSEPTSPSAQQPKEQSYKSSFVSSEEEIDEELSVKSGITSDSFHPERSLDLQILAKPSKETLGDDLIDVASSAKSPTALTSRSAASPSPRDEMPSYIVGDRVLVSNVQPGTLRFKGLTSFANGFWAGVELDKSEGSNDGTYDGVAYFQCKKGHGIFAPPDKVTPLPEKFESFVDTSEDEDSSLDDQSNKTSEKHSSKDSLQRDPLQNEKSRPPDVYSGTKESSNKPSDLEPGQDNLKLDLKDDVNYDILKDLPVPNGRSRDVVLEFEDVSQGNGTLPISVQEKETSQLPEETQTADILDLLDHGEKLRLEGLQESSELLVEKVTSVDQVDQVDKVDGEVSESQAFSTLADKLLDSFMSDTLKQFQEIKKMKEKKIAAANQQKDAVLSEDEELMDSFSQFKSSTRINDFHTFFDQDQEEVSSPELCNRSESPVLGPSGQEELVKRLAELELSRELLDSLGEDQDWFDEDFGLSSRKQQEKLKQRQEEGPLSGSPPAKVPSRPQPPHPKLPEEPAMLVPHNAPEVEKLVSAALLEIWTHCGLDRGQQSLAGVQKPRPSDGFLRNGERNDEQEAEFIRSYKQAVFDLSWEVVQDIFIEDPNADQPQWVKPRRVNSSYIHRINSPNDLAKVQAFVTSEVLKLYGLKKEQNHKTDWQKMLKFGRKKRDRVDHILVQELHEEEALWVNYDEDELFVKMQLADGIFDALLKDTAEILIQIQEKRSKRSQS